MKKIYLDFETNHRNPMLASILEATFLFVENRKIVKTFSNKIYFPEEAYNALVKIYEYKKTFEYNRIMNIHDLRMHNIKSIGIGEFMDSVKNYIEENNLKGMPLSGWNNSSFDNIILTSLIGSEDYNDLFDYHTRDIMHNFRILKEKKLIRSQSLSYTHIELIGTLLKNQFHNSKFDCIATKDLDEWFEDNIHLIFC